MDRLEASALGRFILPLTSSKPLRGANRSEITNWRDETFSLSWEFSWTIWWLLSNKLMSFSDSWWFTVCTWLTWAWSSSISFFLRIRDLRADSLLDITLFSLFSLIMLAGVSLASSKAEPLLGDTDVFGENILTGTWNWELDKNLPEKFELHSGFCAGFAWVTVQLLANSMCCKFEKWVEEAWVLWAWQRGTRFGSLISYVPMAWIFTWSLDEIENKRERDSIKRGAQWVDKKFQRVSYHAKYLFDALLIYLYICWASIHHEFKDIFNAMLASSNSHAILKNQLIQRRQRHTLLLLTNQYHANKLTHKKDITLFEKFFRKSHEV